MLHKTAPRKSAQVIIPIPGLPFRYSVISVSGSSDGEIKIQTALEYVEKKKTGDDGMIETIVTEILKEVYTLDASVYLP